MALPPPKQVELGAFYPVWRQNNCPQWSGTRPDALAMQERAQSLQKRAATDETEQLAPVTTIGMAVGAEIAPADPAAIGTVRIGAEMVRGVDLTAASARQDEARWWGCRGVWAGVACVGTGVAVRSRGEACKGLRLAATRAP